MHRQPTGFLCAEHYGNPEESPGTYSVLSGKIPRGGSFRLESKTMSSNEFESGWLDPLREGISGTGDGIPKPQSPGA